MNGALLFLVFPLVGAIIGWGTNWLAVKMMFRPRTRRRFLGITIEGLIPRRRRELARSVAETVERDLLTVDMIQGLVVQLVRGERIQALLHERIDSLIDEQVNRLGPMIQAFAPKDMISKFKERIESEVLEFIGGMSEEIHRGIEENLDIKRLVEERVESFDLVRLEEIVIKIAAKELKHIEWLGAVLGGLIGVIEAALITLLAAH